MLGRRSADPLFENKMVQLPLRKFYQVAKLTFLLIVILSVLILFEHLRGGKQSAIALYTDSNDAEYERQIQDDEARIIPGLGDGGVGVNLSGAEKILGEESEKQLAVNVYLSDRISYNRTLKDARNPACKRVKYDAELPSTSVIIIFHNEPYSVVIRTLWSVINGARRNNKWFRDANFVDKKTGKHMHLGYSGQEPDSLLVYLKEIILVDDNSTLPELKDKLSHYIRTRLPPDLIRILRLPDRVGLTRARLAGARYATGDVVLFLDAHCEVQPDWLRPLLQKLKDDPTSVVVPVIDVIESSDFYYSVADPASIQGLILARIAGARLARGDVLIFLDAHCEVGTDWLRPLLQRISHKKDAVVTPIVDVIDQTNFGLDAAKEFQVGGFTFNGHFTWIDIPEREKKRRGSAISPTWSPTMAGGLFAMRRSYYWELGAYDEQMSGWGGENLEISFRIWQCGGTLETVPCSRVGHVFRRFHPYGMPASSDTHGINTARMAEVWMDEYKELYYLYRPDLRKSPLIGDVTHRKVLREKLKCKSFQWYLDNIYKEKFVPVRDVEVFGRFMNPLTGFCLDTLQSESNPAPLGVYPCHPTLQPTQYLSISLDGQLRDEENCAHVHTHRRDSARDQEEGRPVMMVDCARRLKEKKWRYIPTTQQIQNIDSKLCLESPREIGAGVVVKECADSKREQRWYIDYTDKTLKNRNDDMGSQEQVLVKLRGQHRISRSLLTQEDANHRRHSVKKNKFVLKLLRNNNGTDEHLEVELHCKHRTLFPNDTFVRDIVTILNDKEIKVLNNGRVFERNRVYDVPKKHKRSKKSKDKKHKKNKHHHVSSTAPPVSLSPAPTPPAPFTALTPAERKIIIEDFVVVTTEATTTKKIMHLAAHKKQRQGNKKKRNKKSKHHLTTTTVAATTEAPASEEATTASPSGEDDLDERNPIEVPMRADANNDIEETTTDAPSAELKNKIMFDDDETEEVWKDVDFRFTDSDERAPKLMNSRKHAGGPASPSRNRHSEENSRDAEPLKLVMRSNLTFNLGDELLQTKKEDVADLLGDLVIPDSDLKQVRASAESSNPSDEST